MLVLGACGSGDSTEPAGGSPPAAEEQPGSDAAGRDDGAAAGNAAQARGVRLAAVGRFDAPLYVTSPPGDERRVFVVQQGGRIMVVRGRTQAPRPLPGHHARRCCPAASRDCCRWPSPRTTRRAGASTSTSPAATAARTWSSTAPRAPIAPTPGARASSCGWTIPSPTTTAACCCSAPTTCCTSAPATAAAANDQHGERGNGQSLGSLLGKILRIDPRASGGRPYRTPSSNPFAGRAGARAEIYSYGLRNPWRFSFDRRTGDLSIADVGQNAVEEVSFVRRGRGRGANFGWRPFEGRTRIFDEPAPGAIAPVITHSHDEGWCSVTGGHVVRDPGVPALAGRYVYGDLCEGRIRSARLRAGRRTTGRPLDLPTVSNLSSFGEDARGRVYVTSLDGPVYRLASR